MAKETIQKAQIIEAAGRNPFASEQSIQCATARFDHEDEKGRVALLKELNATADSMAAQKASAEADNKAAPAADNKAGTGKGGKKLASAKK